MEPTYMVPADDIALAKRLFSRELPDALHFDLFISDCQRLGVSPLSKKLHPQVRSGRYAPVTSIDYMRLRAEATGRYAGSDDAVFAFGDGDYPVAATVTVWKMLDGQRCSFTATARWGEYYPGDGPAGQMWRRMPTVMLSKCAEALALRKGFPGSLSGLYVSEEMDQREKPAAKRPTEKPATEDGPIGAEDYAYIVAEAKERGWKRDDTKAFLIKHYGASVLRDITESQYDKVLADIQKGPNRELPL